MQQSPSNSGLALSRCSTPAEISLVVSANAAWASMAMLWILNLSDGEHSLLEIAERAELAFELIRETAALLEQEGLLRPGDPSC